ncbi:MAG TPA: hypothetical protein VNF91_00110 [Candidatus Acidoferrum sp.]|nr:hypothetical protein [Candidatus Acidoferrum sp.]
MSIQPTAADPLGLGVDIALQGDLNPVWGLVSGFTNLGYAISRRLNAVLGSLFSDLGYGFDLSDLVNQDLLPTDVARISQAMAGQCLLDERVQTCRAALSFDNPSSTLTIVVSGTIATGQQFQFILAANGITVALISVNGATVAPQQPVTVVAGPSTVIVQNGTAAAGPPGPPGPSGSASQDIPIADVISSLGSEEPQPQTQKDIVWADLPATITIKLAGTISSAAGNGVFHVRINGSDGAADGTVVATLTASSSSPTLASNGSTISNPGGSGRLIVTATSNGSNVCELRDATLTIR